MPQVGFARCSNADEATFRMGPWPLVADGVNPRKNDGEIRQPKSEEASGALMIFKDFAWFRTL